MFYPNRKGMNRLKNHLTTVSLSGIGLIRGFPPMIQSTKKFAFLFNWTSVPRLAYR
jgi:hypothetical protein